MKALMAFASRFGGGKIALNPQFIVEKAQRFYLLNPALQKTVKDNFYYAGLYLGKVKNGVFFPSFTFLNMLVPVAANKVVLERKAAWLFICGRDVFRKGIAEAVGALHRGDYSLVMNEHGECLGYGVVTAGLEDAEGNVVVKNVLDVGDFLRREG
jgi:ribosome biogenesis protein Nip4